MPRLVAGLRPAQPGARPGHRLRRSPLRTSRPDGRARSRSAPGRRDAGRRGCWSAGCSRARSRRRGTSRPLAGARACAAAYQRVVVVGSVRDQAGQPTRPARSAARSARVVPSHDVGPGHVGPPVDLGAVGDRDHGLRAAHRGADQHDPLRAHLLAGVRRGEVDLVRGRRRGLAGRALPSRRTRTCRWPSDGTPAGGRLRRRTAPQPHEPEHAGLVQEHHHRARRLDVRRRTRRRRRVRSPSPSSTSVASAAVRDPRGAVVLASSIVASAGLGRPRRRGPDSSSEHADEQRASRAAARQRAPSHGDRSSRRSATGIART